MDKARIPIKLHRRVCLVRTEDAMLAWLELNPQDRFGVQPYSLDGSGVTVADLEPVFDRYLSAFDIELEATS